MFPQSTATVRHGATALGEIGALQRTLETRHGQDGLPCGADKDSSRSSIDRKLLNGLSGILISISRCVRRPRIRARVVRIQIQGDS